MKIDVLLFLENGISDDDLTFLDSFIPDMLSERLARENSRIFYSIPENYNGKLHNHENSFIRNGVDDLTFWKKVFEKTSSDHLIKIYIDSPFIDPNIINEMIEQHTSYLAEFTFSENLPAGFTCEILSKELIDSIPDPEKQTQQLGKVIRSNINQFDIELYYKDPDIRDKRITFRSGNKRDKKIMEGIFNITKSFPSYGELKNIINTNPGILYIAPSYIEVELTGRCDLDCKFCFRNKLAAVRGDMDKGLYKKILTDMKEFGLPYSICLGGSGEPMMHPGFYEILENSAADPLVQQIIVETNGLYADDNYSRFIKSIGRPVIKTIINLNGIDQETYKSLHGNDSYQRVMDNINLLKEIDNSENLLYLQLMKINETEPFTDRYYDFWEQQNITIIFQKQNTFLGLVPDMKYSDLTPMERIPCWHLQRDLSILSDGTITYCKQDVDGKYFRGNIAKDSISSIWNKKMSHFISNYHHQLPASPDCAQCDEWYTFNL